jgi:menaquinone-dependent protoporphyrinogen IX oxidase
MNFHKNWKSFLNEGIKQLTEEELALIAEGRKDDAEKKYPQVNRFVDRLASLDPSPNNKYLMWMTKQLAAELDRQLKGFLITQ